MLLSVVSLVFLMVFLQMNIKGLGRDSKKSRKLPRMKDSEKHKKDNRNERRERREAKYFDLCAD